MAQTIDFIVKNGLKVLGSGSAASTNTASGALIVQGGAGIGGALHVGGDVTLNTGSTVTASYVNPTNLTNLYIPFYNGAILTNTNLTFNSFNQLGGYQAVFSSSVEVHGFLNKNLTQNRVIYTTDSQGNQGDSANFTFDGTKLSVSQAAVTATTVATDTTSGAFTVAGGVGIAGSLYAGNIYDNNHRVLTQVTVEAGTGLSGGGTINGATGTVTLSNSGVLELTSGTDITITGSKSNYTIANASTLQSVTTRGGTTNQAIHITNLTQTTTSTDGALVVDGGVGIAKNLTVGGELNVWGATTFAQPVTFNGTATFVNSTNTVYTDNIIELHVPPGGVGATWGSFDGKDIGLRFHYYNVANSTDTNAALVLAHDTQMLEFYSAGAEDAGGVFTGVTYGGFRTGEIYAESTGNATTSTFGSSGGALQIAGGASIEKDLWVGGNAYVNGSLVATVDSLGGSGVGAIYAGTGISVDQNTGAVTVTNDGVISLIGTTYLGVSASSGSNITLTNLGVQTLTAGTDTVVSSNTGTITVWNNSTLQTVTDRGSSTTNALTFTNTTESTGTSSGAVIVTGGVGIGKALSVGGTVTAGFVNPDNLTSTRVPYYNGTNLTDTSSFTWDNGNQVLKVGAGGVELGGDAGYGYISAPAVKATNLTNTRLVYSNVDNKLVDSANLTFNGSTLTVPALTATGVVNITNATSATSTTTGALRVAGGVGVQGDIYARNLYADGIRVATINDIAAENVNHILAGNGISVNTSTGDVTVTNTGVLGVIGGTDITLSTASGVTTIDNASTLETVTGRGASTPNAITITNTTQSTSTNTGALIVEGGVGIAKDLWLGGDLNVEGTIYMKGAGLDTITGSTGTFDFVVIEGTGTGLTVTNNATIGGILTATTLNVGPAAQAVSYGSQTTSTNATMSLDSYNATVYRTAKYLVQVVDGTDVQAEELLVFHDGTNAYIVRYAVGTNNGELGDWDASYAFQTVTLQFTPNYTPTALSVKTYRTAVTV